MADNFDTNVARRKPHTLKNRPVHPWDIDGHVDFDEIKVDSVDTEVSSDSKDVSGDVSEKITDDSKIVKKKYSKKQIIPSASPSLKEKITEDKKVYSKSSVQNIPAIIESEISKKHSDLSDSINIHSNYCKLDNDISDHLFKNLSSSAQSVYLRFYRQSFGWNRNWAAESLPKLKKACNISLQTVRKAIKELEIKGCIHKEFSDYHKATVYRVFLPSEIGIANNTPPIIDISKRGDAYSSVLKSSSPDMQVQISQSSHKGVQFPDSATFDSVGGKYLEPSSSRSGGLISAIQSVYFPETSIYALLESSGALPKNIIKYISETTLLSARDIIDEFYESIGFSIVSRAQYRKSLIDYFDIIKSGFSPDDIMYAVRWTFKNSRSRPESFSLIKYTIHDAMNDLINELKDVSGEKKRIEEKKEALIKKKNNDKKEVSKVVTNKDLKIWFEVVEELKSNLNEHSFSAFIEPLKLERSEGINVVLNAPQDSVSWIKDHFLNRIQETYRNHVKKEINVEIK